MCDTYVSGDVGYICYECQSEFKLFLENRNLSPTTDVDIHDALVAFMTTRKNDYIQGNPITVDEFFKSYTRD
jgi:hypothetical protein